MVCDEVMTGWYRTGEAFAFQKYEIEPDLVTFAKGITCGYVPLGGVIVSEKIQSYFDDNKMMCGLTYNAHPVGCAAAIATINEYKRLNIKENVALQGDILEDILQGFVKRHNCVGEFRRVGLFAAIELIKDKQRTPIVEFNNDSDGVMAKIIKMLMKEGFFTYSHENIILIAPPLIIKEDELRSAMKILDVVLDSVDSMI